MSGNILMQVVFSIVVLWVATHFTRQAKAQATNGIISGTVTDASGAAVPGVTIQVKNVNTGVTRTVLTNEQGRYRVPDLLVGAYEVQGSLPGFQTVVQRNPAHGGERTRGRLFPSSRTAGNYGDRRGRNCS